jgi:hypothetical protein
MSFWLPPFGVADDPFIGARASREGALAIILCDQGRRNDMGTTHQDHT